MKKLVATVAALAFAASLTACGEAGEKAAEETAEAEQRIADETQRVVADIGTMAADLALMAAGRLTREPIRQDEANAAVEAVMQGGR